MLAQCFSSLVHALLDDAVRNSVAIELHLKDLISNEVKNEATRVAGDPEQKAFAIADELHVLSNTSPEKLLSISRAVSQISAVNRIGEGMEELYWRIVYSAAFSGTVYTMSCMQYYIFSYTYMHACL